MYSSTIFSLLAVLPFLSKISALPQEFRPNAEPPVLPGNTLDGTFTLDVLGAENFVGQMGLGMSGKYEAYNAVQASAQVERYRPDSWLLGGEMKDQQFKAFFALKSDPSKAIIECVVTTTDTIPANSKVTFDLKDPAKPTATAPKGVFKDAGCKTVQIKLGD